MEEGTNGPKDLVPGPQNGVSRRNIASLVLGALGAAAVTGCANAASGAENLGTSSAALSGTDVLWFDVITTAVSNSLGNTPGPATSQMAIVAGYWAPNDGGGGIFYWDPAATATPDGGTILQPPGVTTGRWTRVHSGALNVRWFGAKGDGVNDDTAAIQSTIQAATGFDASQVNGGSRGFQHGSVYFALGDYKVTSTLVYTGSVGASIKLAGELGSGYGESYSGTTLSWYGPSGGTLVDLIAITGSTIENLAFDGRGVANTCVWYRSNQHFFGQNAGGSDLNMFRSCTFVNVAPNASAYCFTVGDADANTWQVDNTVWENCFFNGAQSFNTSLLDAAACWKTLQGGNTKNFTFYRCGFGGAHTGIDWSLASGTLTVDSCGFATFGPASWSSGAPGTCILLGPGGNAVVRSCEVECFPDQSGISGGAYFIGYVGGGLSTSITTLHVEGCQVFITMPPDNIVVAYSGRLSLIGNAFLAGYGCGSSNQSPPQIATGFWPSIGEGDTACTSIFSVNNVYPFQPADGFAPFILVGGNPPQQALLGTSGYYGGSPMAIWSLGDVTIDHEPTACTPLQPWFGQSPRTGQTAKFVAYWSVNPVPNAACATYLFRGAGIVAGMNVGDSVLVSCDEPLPAGVSLTGAVTAPNTVTITAMNLSGDAQTLAGNVIIAIHRQTYS